MIIPVSKEAVKEGKPEIRQSRLDILTAIRDVNVNIFQRNGKRMDMLEQRYLILKRRVNAIYFEDSSERKGYSEVKT